MGRAQTPGKVSTSTSFSEGALDLGEVADLLLREFDVVRSSAAKP